MIRLCADAPTPQIQKQHCSNFNEYGGFACIGCTTQYCKNNISQKIDVCIIPAREGSKRIPQKNIRIFQGHPIISYAITTALNSNIFKKVCVSTESDMIAEIAEQYNASVIQRPQDLATDNTPIADVMQHAILTMDVETACCLFPVSPLITTNHLRDAIVQFLMTKKQYVFSAKQIDPRTARAFTLENNGVTPLAPKYSDYNTQNLNPLYIDAGAFYIGSAAAWLSKLPILSEHSTIFVLSNEYCMDVDTETDWAEMERKYQKHHFHNCSEVEHQ